MRIHLLVLLVFIISFCSNDPKPPVKKTHNTFFEASITELTEKEYPDDPDIALRGKNYGKLKFSRVQLHPLNADEFRLVLVPANLSTDTITFPKLKITEWIPTVPEHIRQDEYLSKISCVNLEWNRQQVRFDDSSFFYIPEGQTKQLVSRIDLARNCLSTKLWEIIMYENENEFNKPLYHGWFDFPMELFSKLFEYKNGFPFSKFEEYLIDWKDPESQIIDLNKLRIATNEAELTFSDRNNKMYSLKGERKKKFQNIIYPKNPRSINDFLTDSTLFATFTPPGFYNTADPRKTELGRLRKLVKVIGRGGELDGMTGKFKEIELVFNSLSDSLTTKIVLGGFDISKVPTLPDSLAHRGYQMPMGIGNHSFYESYTKALKNPSETNHYYGLILDKDENWLDSHKIGIDGPLMYFNEAGDLNLLLLSFERHAIVGHYVIKYQR